MSRTAQWAVLKDNVTRAKGQWGSGTRKGAGARARLTVGKRDGYVHRSFLKFDFDESDIGVLLKAELVISVLDTDYDPGVDSRVTVHRLVKSFSEGNSNSFVAADALNTNVASGRSSYKNASGISAGDEVRIDITAMVGPWLAKYKRWMDGSVEKAGWDKPNHGLRLKSKESGEQLYRYGFQFAAREHATAAKHPYIEITYDPPNYSPDIISTIEPAGTVLPGTDFSGEFGDPNNEPPDRIKVQVRRASNENVVWNPPPFPFDAAWIDNGGTWTWTVPNPGSGVLKASIAYEWRAKGYDQGGKDSGWTSWRGFSQSGTVPTVVLRPIGTLETLTNYEFLADWVADPSEEVVSYRVQMRADGDLWTQTLWDHTFLPLRPEEKAGVLTFPYGGPRLPAGTYHLRLLVVDSLGVSSAWSADASVVLTVGSEQDQDSGGDALPPNLTGYARGRPRVRIILRANDGPDRGPGTVKAIIEDAHNVGMSQVVNEPGEFYFTLTSLHPQAGECEPWQRHYALQQYRNGSWVDISNGLLTDFDAGDNDIVVYGLDYMGVLSRSVDTRFPPPGENIHAPHAKGGAKYKDEQISDIVWEQLDTARNQTDSPTGFFKKGTWQTLNTKVSIYSSFKARLDFIRGLLESHRQGTGRRTRLKARQDPSQNDRWEWDLRNSAGADRDNLRMEYGSILQNFRVIAMGEDFATRAHGVGTEPNNVKPRYFVWPGVGNSDFLTATFGNLQRVEVYDDIIDMNDLKRRVKQMQKESSKVGKRIRLAIRVHGVNPYDGYDLADNIPLDIERGLVDTDKYGSGYWTIWGLEYRLFPDGHDELTWALKPREDDETPDPDLIPTDPIHYTPEWYIGNGPPPDCSEPQVTVFAAGDPEPVVQPCDCYFYLDMDNGMTYKRVANPDYDTWEEEGLIPGDPLVVPPGYPGDGVAPDPPTAFDVTTSFNEHDDGTVEPVLVATWTDAGNADIIGYEVEWDVTDLDDGDPPLPIPPDFVTKLSVRFGVGVGVGVLSPVIGGRWYGTRIRAYDMEGLPSTWVLGPILQAPPDLSAPDIPEGLAAAGGYRLVGVTWAASSAFDISFYQYRYRVTGDPEWSNRFKAKANRVIIDGLEDEVEYEVEVRAIDRSGNVRVSGDPEQGDEVIANYQDDTEAGWTVPPVTAVTSLVATDSVAFKNIISDFLSSGQITADQIIGGELLLGRPGHEGTLRIYDDQGRPTGAWGDFGWIIGDPENPGRAIWAIAGAIYFTSQYQMDDGGGGYIPWDGTDDLTQDLAEFLDPPTNEVPNPNYLMWDVTRGIESGVAGTVWTTAIDWRGVNAESITFGSQFGGNNRLLNAGFELQDFDTATIEIVEYTDSTDWGTPDPTNHVNMDVTGTELRMLAH